MQELERICLPKLNIIVERQQFRRLEQEEDESINNFENRVRTKAMVCGTMPAAVNKTGTS